MIKRTRRTTLRVESLEGRALLTAGALDTSFGGTGQVTTFLSSGSENSLFYPQQVAVQSNLDTVVAGLEFPNTPSPSPAVSTVIVRYNVNGSLDTSFGSGGEVVLPTTSILESQPGKSHHEAVAIQPNGQILVETDTATLTTTTTRSGTTYTIDSINLLVLRLNSNGSLDTTFGNGGEVDLQVPQGNVIPVGMAVLPSGEIVVAGTNPGILAGPEYMVARLTSTGALDTTFGPNGQGYNYLALSSTTTAPIVDGFGVDASGNILLGGNYKNPTTGDWGPAVVRYTANGLLDTTFANQGIYEFPTVGHGPNSIGFEPGGQIVLGMMLQGETGEGVVELNSNGTLDTSFGSNGVFSDPDGEGYSQVAVQPDGDLVIEMEAYNSSLGETYGVLIDRLLPSGSLDPTFGSGGQTVIDNSESGITSGITVGPDGNITGIYDVSNSAGTSIGSTTFRLLGDPVTTGQIVVTEQPPASLVAGTPFGLSVEVEDSSGNLESSYDGPVTVGLASGADNSSIGGTLTVTASNGVATFSGLTLTKAATGYTLLVTGTSLGDAVTTPSSVSPSTPSQVVFTQEPPTSVTAGTGFGLQASIEDSYGNVVTSASGTVTLALANSPAGATLGGTLTATAGNGVATFSGLTLTQAASGYTFQVSSSGLGGSVSSALSVTAAAASKLLITEQPTTIGVNATFTLVVEIVDAYGNVVTSDNGSVTISLGTAPSGAKLGGKTTVTAVNGVATFSGLTLNKAGTGYTILISSKGLTGATAGPISVTG